MLKQIDIELEFAPIINQPPVTPKQLFKQAASNDETTVDAWKDTWIRAAKENHATRGPFAANSIGKFFGKYQNRGCIVVGSGPSLKINVAELAKASKFLPVVSCLHNFHFLEDRGVEVDFYVTLDAGIVTVEEVSEGGARTPEEYWALTKGKKLLAYIGANPELIKRWQGEIYWFNCPIPSAEIMRALDAIEPFNLFVSNGGNVLGAAFYAAKAIMAANPIIFAGADFSFSYDKKFHGWDSKYDATVGEAFKVPDIFGNKRYTWQSYYNFKCWFDHVFCTVPGIYYNATEGGCMGAYEGGNIRQITQISMGEIATMYSHHEILRPQCENPGTEASSANPVPVLF